jgi:predicted permease
MGTLLGDVRHSIRVLRAHPGLTAVAVLSLALGIGPNTAVFSLIEGLGFRPLPIEEPATLVQVVSFNERKDRDELSFPEFIDVRESSQLFSGVAASAINGVGVSGKGREPELLIMGQVSAGYFELLGVQAQIGRTLLPEDDRAGAAPAIVLSDRYWRRRFGADPAALGQQLRLNGLDCTIAGVLPRGFDGTMPLLAPDVWVPFALNPLLGAGGAALESRDSRSITVLARLREGATLEQARAEMSALGVHLAERYPDSNKSRTLGAIYESQTRRGLFAVVALLALAFVGLILLIACANVAGLLLGRAEARRGEMAIRMAIGASRGRLVRQFLTESAVMSLLAAIAAVLLAWWSVRLLPALIPPLPLPINLDFRIDARVMAFTFVVAMTATPLFALLPALLASRSNVVPLLKGEPSGPARRLRRLTMRNGLVVGQIAISVVLLIASGLLVRSFLGARHSDPGLEMGPMVISTMAPPVAGYDKAGTEQLFDRLIERLNRHPSVRQASMARHMPLNQFYGGGGMQRVHIPGHQPPDGAEAFGFSFNVVAPGFFETIGTPVVRGRAFDERDHAGGPAVVLVNETMARRFWPDESPLGAQIELLGPRGTTERRPAEVIGVVRDAKYLSLTEHAKPYLYLPYAQRHAGEMTVIARYHRDDHRMMEIFRQELNAVDPALPTTQLITLDQHLGFALVVERLLAGAVGVLGGAGLLMAVVGLYGVVSYTVTRRRKEIGIRMALGATMADVRRAVLRSGLSLAAVGTLIGVVAGGALATVAASSLYGVRPWDPATYLVASATVLSVALVASYVPARRAAAVDPMLSLRQN